MNMLLHWPRRLKNKISNKNLFKSGVAAMLVLKIILSIHVHQVVCKILVKLLSLGSVKSYRNTTMPGSS